MDKYPFKDVKALADSLGIDLRADKEQYLWFIKQALSSLIPDSWQLERARGRTFYHNKELVITSEKHPMLYRFRAAFNRLIMATVKRAAENEKDTRRQGRLPSIGNVKLQSTGEVSVLSPEQQKEIFESLCSRKKDEDADPVEAALNDCSDFYYFITEDQIDGPPDVLTSSLKYQQIDPERMRNKAVELGVSDKPHLYWIARMALVLPMPPCWFKRGSTPSVFYYNSEYDVKFSNHPAQNYLKWLIRKQRKVDYSEYNYRMRFVDKQMQPFILNLKRWYKNKPGAISYLPQESVPEWNSHKEEQETKFDGESEYQVLSQNLMMFDVAEAIGLDMEKDIHILHIINNLLANFKEKGSLADWEFRITDEGKKYWYDLKKKRSMVEFPYATSIAKHVNMIRRLLQFQSQSYYREVQERHEIFNLNPILYDRAMEQSVQYMDALIDKKFGGTFTDPIDLKNLREQFAYSPTKNELLSLMFANPYDIGMDEGMLSFAQLEDPQNISVHTDEDLHVDSDVELDDSDLLEKFRNDADIKFSSKVPPGQKRGSIMKAQVQKGEGEKGALKKRKKSLGRKLSGEMSPSTFDENDNLTMDDEEYDNLYSSPYLRRNRAGFSLPPVKLAEQKKKNILGPGQRIKTDPNIDTNEISGDDVEDQGHDSRKINRAATDSVDNPLIQRTFRRESKLVQILRAKTQEWLAKKSDTPDINIQELFKRKKDTRQETLADPAILGISSVKESEAEAEPGDVTPGSKASKTSKLNELNSWDKGSDYKISPDSDYKISITEARLTSSRMSKQDLNLSHDSQSPKMRPDQESKAHKEGNLLVDYDSKLEKSFQRIFEKKMSQKNSQLGSELKSGKGWSNLAEQVVFQRENETELIRNDLKLHTGVNIQRRKSLLNGGSIFKFKETLKNQLMNPISRPKLERSKSLEAIRNSKLKKASIGVEQLKQNKRKRMRSNSFCSDYSQRPNDSNRLDRSYITSMLNIGIPQQLGSYDLDNKELQDSKDVIQNMSDLSSIHSEDKEEYDINGISKSNPNVPSKKAKANRKQKQRDLKNISDQSDLDVFENLPTSPGMTSGLNSPFMSSTVESSPHISSFNSNSNPYVFGVKNRLKTKKRSIGYSLKQEDTKEENEKEESKEETPRIEKSPETEIETPRKSVKISLPKIQSPHKAHLSVKERADRAELIRKIRSQIKLEIKAKEESIISESPFDYYTRILGPPENLDPSRLSVAPPYVTPQLVIQAGLRLGLSIHDAPMQSKDSWLAWIPFLQISTPTQQKEDKSQIFRLALGKHASDDYFQQVISINKSRKTSNEIGSLRKENLESRSWLQFTYNKTQHIWYNFYTGKASLKTASQSIASMSTLASPVNKHSAVGSMDFTRLPAIRSPSPPRTTRRITKKKIVRQKLKKAKSHLPLDRSPPGITNLFGSISP